MNRIDVPREIAKPADGGEYNRSFSVRKRRGWLIHNEETGICSKGLEN